MLKASHNAHINLLNNEGKNAKFSGTLTTSTMQTAKPDLVITDKKKICQMVDAAVLTNI